MVYHFQCYLYIYKAKIVWDQEHYPAEIHKVLLRWSNSNYFYIFSYILAMDNF